MRKIQLLKLGAGGFILAFCLLFYTYVYHSAQPTNASMPKKESVVSDIHIRMKIMEETDNAVFVSIHQNKYESSYQWGTQVFYSPNTTSSAALADCIQKSVVSTLQPDNKREIKKSGSSIYLLYYAKKTAVLVECGFLSNPQETAKLKDEAYQKQLAFSVALGILEYMNS